jgi:predicted nucleic-acid-binding Zn-ribbon protein
MPKCLDCGNIKKFSYSENSYNEATYDDQGDLLDVEYKQYYDITDGKCMECESDHIEGKL